MDKAKLYLIPNLLGETSNPDDVLPSNNKKLIASLQHFAVEHIKNARRFLVKTGLKSKIDESHFIEINKHSSEEVNREIIQYLKDGHSVGVLSDAGCPSIADPGSQLCALAHQCNFEVIPLTGPSSILLALMASGFNGQSFAFNGYLDRDSQLRIKQLRRLEEIAIKTKQTQIFMETPYRNEALWKDLLDGLRDSTLLCAAVNISLPNQFIKSKCIADWKKTKQPELHKSPAIFLLSN